MKNIFLFLLFFSATLDCGWEDDWNELKNTGEKALETFGRNICVSNTQEDDYDKIPEARGPEGNNSDGNNSPHFLDRLRRLFDDPPQTTEAATNCNESDLAQESGFEMISKEEHPEVKNNQQLPHSIWWW